jgi:tRNA 2-selenouridine synthase
MTQASSVSAGRATAELDPLLARGGPFIDLRSPGEFAAGAVPGAVNLPLLTDAERHQVGLTYKRQGQAAAVATGEALVSGETKARRLAAWHGFAEAHPGAWLYCWRGGLRSEIAQRWLGESGIDLPRVPGGFKALRHRCLALLDEAPRYKRWTVLGGRTGSGKTVVLNRVEGAIDLEGLANHRGSAFGAMLTPQPPPVAFENALAVAWLRHRHPVLVLEDESRTIGRLAVPRAWHDQMQRSPLVILEADLESRVQHIRDEYVWQPLAAGVAAATLLGRMLAALERITRRLGGVRKAEIENELRRGFAQGDHAPWILRLLEWYYDPMYDYQLEGKRDRVVFRGTATDTQAFIADLACCP